MAPRVPRSQQNLFYNGTKWNRVYEQEFVFRMAEYAQEANITLNRSNVTAIRSSIDSVNHKYGTRFTQKDAINFFKRLQHRHFVFGFIITLPHVEYDEERNRVLAEPFVWDYVTLKYPIAEAYMLCGEPDWIELHSIFGNPSPVDVFAELDVIQISDDPSDQNQPNVNRNSRRSMQAPHAAGPADLSSSFWNRLGMLPGTSDVESQNSVHNNPPPQSILPPRPMFPITDDNERECHDGPSRDSIGSQVGSSATPTKHRK